jgi:hypothetical protein
MTAGHDDHDLLAELGEALAEARDVPPGFARSGRVLYPWLTVDAELSRLVHDSDVDAGALVRADADRRRSLTFSSARLTLELDVERDPDALRGQLVTTDPAFALPAQVVVEAVGAAPVTVPVEPVGYFAVEPFTLSGSHFRLRCGDVITPWIG